MDESDAKAQRLEGLQRKRQDVVIREDQDADLGHETTSLYT
jgi:hypothetical protein